MKYATYSTQAHEASLRTRRFVLTTMLVVVVFAADVISHGAIRAPLARLATSTQRTVEGVTDSVFATGYFSTHTQLSAENESLRSQLAHLQSVASSAAAVQAQNAELSKLAHLSQVHPGITTTVSSQESTFGTFYIAAGDRDGVANGDIIRSADGYAIATVIETQQSAALCRSVFAPNTSIDVLDGSERFTLEGRGGGNARGKAQRGAQVKEGDPVTAPSLRGYPVGIVGHTEGGASDAALDVYVRTSVAIDSTQYVYVERP
jgi:cell shape-determining protein MreC